LGIVQKGSDVDDEQRRLTNEYKAAYHAEVLKREFGNGSLADSLANLARLNPSIFESPVAAAMRLNPSLFESPVAAAIRTMADASREEAAVVELVRRDLAIADVVGAGREQFAPGGAPQDQAAEQETPVELARPDLACEGDATRPASDPPPRTAETALVVVDDRHAEYMKLFAEIQDQDKTSIENWASENRLSRSAVYYYRSGKLAGKVSDAKRDEIEKAISASAKRLRLNSD
jgi:hypothetical protein